jgi:hypothetical protein
MPVLTLAHRLILHLILNSHICDVFLIIKVTHQMAGLPDSFRYVYHNNVLVSSFLTTHLT